MNWRDRLTLRFPAWNEVLTVKAMLSPLARLITLKSA
jgi:hypothetical protein